MRVPAWLTASLLLCLGPVTAWAADPPAAVEDKPILILGVWGTEGVANDPDDPHNIAAYTHNFAKVVPLSYRSDGSSKGIDKLADMTDVLAAAREVVTGSPLQRTQDVLRSIRKDVGNQTVFAHSWSTVAVVNAINSGLIPAPKSLVLINPPVLTAFGAAQWRAFAEKHPDMPIDIYIGIDDPSERAREMEAGLHPSGGLGATPGDAISGFLTPSNPARIQVRMYPGGHRLGTFFDFAARHHLNGITSSAPAPTGAGLSLPALMPSFNGIFGPPADLSAPVRAQPESGYAFLTATQGGLGEAEKTARLQDMQTYGLTREQLQAREKQAEAQLHQTRWDVLQTIADTTCNTPYVLDEADRQGLLTTFSIPIDDVKAGLAAHRSELSACQQELIKLLLDKPSPVPFAWLAQWGKDYRHEHSLTTRTTRFFQHVGSLIASGAEGFLDGLAAVLSSLPDGSDSGSDSGSGSERSGRGSGYTGSGSSGHMGGGEALGQAGTINLTGSWGGN